LAKNKNSITELDEELLVLKNEVDILTSQNKDLELQLDVRITSEGQIVSKNDDLKTKNLQLEQNLYDLKNEFEVNNGELNDIKIEY
jgi:predicted  nucleic acid-binding Zn-ribbon protein